MELHAGRAAATIQTGSRGLQRTGGGCPAAAAAAGTQPAAAAAAAPTAARPVVPSEPKGPGGLCPASAPA